MPSHSHLPLFPFAMVALAVGPWLLTGSQQLPVPANISEQPAAGPAPVSPCTTSASDHSSSSPLRTPGSDAPMIESAPLSSDRARRSVEARSRIEAVWSDPAATVEQLQGALRQLGTAIAADADADMVTLLLDFEAVAAQRGVLAAWLDALGHAARSEAADAARRHLEHADSSVRGAAVLAVLRSDSSASQALERLAVGDPDSFVRSRAVATLARRQDSAVLATLVRVLDLEPASDVRNAALLVVARHGDHAAATSILDRVALTDPVESTRSLAFALLARRRA